MIVIIIPSLKQRNDGRILPYHSLFDHYLLKEQQPYRELGPDHAEEQALEASKRWAVRRLEQLGFQVTLQSDEVASWGHPIFRGSGMASVAWAY